MNINFYKFSKKINSTKQPSSSTTYTQLDCKLKEPSSVIRPTLQVSGLTNPFKFNYCYIPTFTRYYFIKNWAYVSGLWECELNIDVLASYKTDIGNSSLYVLRSASDFNGHIKDDAYPPTYDTVEINNYASDDTVYDSTLGTHVSNYFSKDYTSGYFVLGVVGGDVNGVTYYGIQASNFASLINDLVSYVPEDIEDVGSALAKQITNPLQHITSCFWYPSSPGGFETTRTIKFGYYGISVDNVSILGSGASQGPIIHRFSKSYSITDHPQVDKSSSKYYYLNTTPYTFRKLIFNPFGAIPIDTSKITFGAPSTSIQVEWYVDFTTGIADLYVNSEAIELGSATAQFGVPIKVSQIMENFITSLGSAAKTGIAIGAANAYLPGVALVTGVMGVSSAIAEGYQTSVNTIGSNGTFLPFKSKRPFISSLFYKITNVDNTNLGRPLCETKTLNTLSGFTVCRSGNLSIQCYDQELQMIKDYLEGGFYYE